MQVTQLNVKGNATVYCVSSKFKTGQSWVVTMVMANRATKNTFWDKHILRVGERSSEIFEMRNSGKPNSPAFNPGKANLGFADVATTGAPASTVIRLKKVNFNRMLYSFAKCLVEAYQRGEFGGVDNYIDELPTPIVFDEAESVATVDGGVTPKQLCRSIKVGGYLRADAPPTLTFEINHAKGAGPI